MPSEDWQRFEFVFQASRDLKPADSRFAIYFASTGTLWLDDVAIEETTAPKRERLPVISMEGVKNALPNSSFECGGDGWGCPAQGPSGAATCLSGWVEWDQSQAFDGKAPGN